RLLARGAGARRRLVRAGHRHPRVRMIYRKWGRVVRWENGTLVRVEEAGEAREENGVFYAQPIEHRVIPSVSEGPPADVIAVAEGILRCAQDDTKVERCIVTHGVALHEYA